MSNNIEQGATPEATPAQATPTATVTNPTTPQGNQGATPAIQLDTAAHIADLTRDRDSANARIKELNSENKKYRLLSENLTALGVTPEQLKPLLEQISGYKALGTIEDLSAKIQRAQRADELEREQACQLAGIDPADFSSRKGVDEWKIEVKTEDKDGKKVKVPYVTFDKDGKPEAKPLAEHAFATFPTLAKVGGETGQQQQQVQQRGAWVAQGSQNNGGAGNGQSAPIPKPANYSM